jgi:hypothetical protein
MASESVYSLIPKVKTSPWGKSIMHKKTLEEHFSQNLDEHMITFSFVFMLLNIF